VESQALRAHFPVLAHTAYLNAGTDGPLPAIAARAGAHELRQASERGRTLEHFERRRELAEQLRGAYAAALGCRPADVALTTCTTEGLSIVIDGLRLGRHDEILTSDEEHPGLLGPLAGARARQGVEIRTAPLGEIACAVGPRTRLVACSHVSWMSGALAPAELAELGVPVLLDGAQGVGAVPVDVGALGCAAYAGAGQKWLCGPDGSGMLYVGPALRERLTVSRRGYGNLRDPAAGLDAQLHEDARRFESPALSAETLATALAAVEILGQTGWRELHARAASLAGRLAESLRGRGRTVASPPGQSTLVSFSSPDPQGERARLAGQGVVLRDVPGRSWLRASVGAWNDESDLDRLLDGLIP
jgi:selenocysteine lyase/cysteine desulfurase